MSDDGRVDLADFLLARIAEDEAVARAASSAMWLPEDKGITFDWRFEDLPDPDGRARLEANTWANVDHISQWSPQRVMAECAAKRKIAGAYEILRDAGAEGVVHVLAAVYADHPDYDEAWRP